jgi:hypothetical protein
VKKTSEERLKALFVQHPFPPLEVVIPVLEKSGRGEQELTSQLYDTYANLARGIMEILRLKPCDMKTLVRVFEVVTSFFGSKIESIETSESKFSISLPDCPMCHVGKNISSNVRSKYCDLVCECGSQALTDVVLGKGKAKCSWDKSLVKDGSKCTTVFEIVKTK